jgi:hypothetical protein
MEELTVSAELVLDAAAAAELRDSMELSGEARPALRTLSMPARRLRRVASVALPLCALLLAGLYGVGRHAARQPTAAARARPAMAAAALQDAPAPTFELAPQAEPPQPALETRAAARGKLGRLSINTKPWSTVYLGSRVLGTTPLADVAVPRATLELKLGDRDGRVHRRRLAASRKAARSIFYDFETSTRAPFRAVEARGSAREQNVEARGSAREQNADARAREQNKGRR